MKNKMVTEEEIRERQREVIGAFCQKYPPDVLVGWPDKYDGLQNWIGLNLKTRFEYASPLAIMEAAEAIARSPIEVGEERHEDNYQVED